MSEYNKCCVPNPISDVTAEFLPDDPTMFDMHYKWTPKPDCVYTEGFIKVFRRNADGSIDLVLDRPIPPVFWPPTPGDASYGVRLYGIAEGEIYFGRLEARIGCQRCGEIQSPDVEAGQQLILYYLDPDNGPMAGGTPVEIWGADFEEGTTVTIDGNPVTNLVFVDPEKLTGDTPAGTAGAKDVTATNPDTKFYTLVGGFTYT